MSEAQRAKDESKIAQGLPRLRLQLLRLDHHLRRLHQADALAPRMIVQELQRRFAEAALRHIEDALEGEIVGGLRGGAQISERIADFGALIKARAADDAIGQAERDEALFEFAHLEGRAHKNGDLVEIVPLVLQGLDLVADRARFFLAIPKPGDTRLFACFAVGEERLAEAALIMRDEAGGGCENMAGRAVIALEPDDLRAGKILAEAQDVIDIGAAPAIDRLIVVADAADIVPALGQELQPEILDRVRVLIFIDQHVAEAVLKFLQHIRIFAKEPQAFEQKIAEIGGVQNFQPLLIELIKLLPLAIAESRGFARRHMRRRQPAILPGIDLIGEAARRPALFIDIFGGEHLLQQPDLIVGVENGEGGFEADKLGMTAQNLGRDRVERAEPGHAFAGRAGEQRNAVLHLARRLVGEGDGENLGRVGAAQ